MNINVQSLTVPNLLPNEHELTIRVCSGDHSWSFLLILAIIMTMTINSNSVLLHVDSYIFLLFSYSIRFILVRSCEILGRTEQCSSHVCTFIEKQPCSTEFVLFEPSTKKNGHEFQNFYIRQLSAVDSAQ